MHMKVVFAGGGTAGHLYPAVAVARELRRRDPRCGVLFLVSRRGAGRQYLKEHGFQFRELAVSGVGRPLPLRSIPAAVKMLGAFVRSRRLLRLEGANAVVGFGAYVSVAPVLAAYALGLRIIVHEQNAVMGRANRCLVPLADRVAVGLPPRAGMEGGGRYTFTGIPLRPELYVPMKREDAIDFLGLERGAFTLLVLGGSQGAHAVNGLVMQSASFLGKAGDVQVVHLAGSKDYGDVVKAYVRAGVRASVFPYLGEMGWAYAAADLAVCRCGATTLAELAQAGLPSVLIPFPHAVGDHQAANGRIFEEAGAAILRRESALLPEELAEIVMALKSDSGKRALISGAARSLASPHAAEKLADIIEETAGT
jgi:UDP-N-acetylglucosamine--N-acetylmuramyl-(pentapeptide) pyrophosphoryl-undecaprenol N-acetylglucosamine transferase